MSIALRTSGIYNSGEACNFRMPRAYLIAISQAEAADKKSSEECDDSNSFARGLSLCSSAVLHSKTLVSTRNLTFFSAAASLCPQRQPGFHTAEPHRNHQERQTTHEPSRDSAGPCFLAEPAQGARPG